MLPSEPRNGKGGISSLRRMTRTQRRLRTQLCGPGDLLAELDRLEGPLSPIAIAPDPNKRRSNGGGGSAAHLFSASAKLDAYCQPSSASTRGCVKLTVQSDLWWPSQLGYIIGREHSQPEVAPFCSFARGPFSSSRRSGQCEWIIYQRKLDIASPCRQFKFVGFVIRLRKAQLEGCALSSSS